MLLGSTFRPIGEVLCMKENIENSFEYISSFVGDLLDYAKADEDRISSASKPVADLSASPTDVEVHETVTFDGRDSYDPDGSVVSYWYAFGDPFDSGWTSQSTYEWEYTDPGDYYAKLKVKDNDGEVSSWSSTVHIHVGAAANQKPVAILSASKTVVEPQEWFEFDGSASYDPDGSVVSYWYDFGDGFDSGWTSQSTYDYRYSDEGHYYAKLKVKDDDDAVSGWSSTVHIHVASAPPMLSITDVYFDSLEIGGTSEVRIMIENVGEGPFSGGSGYINFEFKDSMYADVPPNWHSPSTILNALVYDNPEMMVQSDRSDKVTLPPLAPGESARVEFYVRPNPLASPSFVFANRIYLSFDSPIPSSGTFYEDYYPHEVITFSTGQIWECATFVVDALLTVFGGTLDAKLAQVLAKYGSSLNRYTSALVRIFSQISIEEADAAYDLAQLFIAFGKGLKEAYSSSDFLSKLRDFAWTFYLEIGGKGALCLFNVYFYLRLVYLAVVVKLIESAILTLTEAISVFGDLIAELGGSILDLLGILSPADVLLKDEAGRVTGYYDGTVYEQIDGSVVIIEEDRKFIFAPSGAYDIVINGTGSGIVHCYMILASGNMTFIIQHEFTVDVGTTVTGIFGSQEQGALTKSNATEVTQVLPKTYASVTGDETVTTLKASVFVWLDNQPYMINVESDAAISTPSYDEQACEISFTASGSTGSSWHTKLLIPSALLPENPILQVYVNGSRIDAGVAQEEDNYVVDFAGHFSMVNIVVRATPSTIHNLWVIGGVIVGVLALIIVFVAAKKRRSGQKGNS